MWIELPAEVWWPWSEVQRLLQRRALSDDSLPFSRHALSQKKVSHWQGFQNILEQLGGEEDGIDCTFSID